MLSDHCLSCLSLLSVTLVYRGQAARWIKVPLGMEVGLSPGHIILDGDQLPHPERGTAVPTFQPMSFVAKTTGCIRISLGMEVDLGPVDIVLDEDPAFSKERAAPAPTFRSMSIVAKW